MKDYLIEIKKDYLYLTDKEPRIIVELDMDKWKRKTLSYRFNKVFLKRLLNLASKNHRNIDISIVSYKRSWKNQVAMIIMKDLSTKKCYALAGIIKDQKGIQYDE